MTVTLSWLRKKFEIARLGLKTFMSSYDVTHQTDDVNVTHHETPYGYITQQEAPQETLSLLPALTLSSCRFSHATNTRSFLTAACAANDDEINIIEADVLYASSIPSFMTAIRPHSKRDSLMFQKSR